MNTENFNSPSVVEWCNICNSRPGDGKLTVMVEGVAQQIDACYGCVTDPDKVVFE